MQIPHPLLPNSIVAKKKKGTNNFKPYWEINGFASTDRGLYHLDNDAENNNGTNTQDESKKIDKREKHEPSFSTALMTTRQFSRQFGLKTGIIYSNTAIVIAPHEMYATQQPNGSIAYKFIASSGYSFVKPAFGPAPTVGDSIKSATAQHNLQSTSLPLMLLYKLNIKKFSIMPAAGVSANFITRATIQTEVTEASNRETVNIDGLNGMRNFYMGFIADIDLQYRFNKKWSANLLPAFKYAITPITKNNVVKTFPYSFGIGAGFSYKF